MSGNFVIWDITTPEVEAIKEIFLGAKWGQLAHRENTQINGMNSKYPGWNATTDKVYNDGVSDLGFPSNRDMIPPHNYISFKPSEINPVHGDTTNLVQNLSLASNRSFYTWLRKLAIVPINDPSVYSFKVPLQSVSSENLRYSNTQLPIEILKKVKNVLDPNNAPTRATELMNAFGELLKLPNVITLEIYSIDGVKISDMRNGGNHQNPEWFKASI